MSRPKRQSMKGKGLGTFFPETEPEPEAEQQTSAARVLHALPAPDESEASMQARSPESRTANTQETPSEYRSGQVDQRARLQASMNASLSESERASTQASEHVSSSAPPTQIEVAVKPEGELASMQASEQLENQGEKPGPSTGDPLGELWPVLAEPATITNAFRFADGELERLSDVVYQISKRHAVKVPKQDVVRLALGAVLLEYEREGDESLLGRYICRRKQWRRGGE